MVYAASKCPLMVPILCNRKDIDINQHHRGQDSALIVAARKNHLETVQLLLDLGANINVINLFF